MTLTMNKPEEFLDGNGIVYLTSLFIMQIENKFGEEIPAEKVNFVIDSIERHASVYDALMERAFKRAGVKTPSETTGALHQSALALWEVCFSLAMLTMFNKQTLRGVDKLISKNTEE